MTTVTIDNRVLRVVSNIHNLPTPPLVFYQIEKLINDPDVSAAKIASVLAEDPAMSAKVLKLTNSAFYGLAREVDSIKHAVTIIGLEAVRNLVLSASVLDMFKGTQTDSEYQEAFWQHSLATGLGSRIIARETHSHSMLDPDSAFSAGLLHDIGKLIICCYLPQEYLALKEAWEQSDDVTDLELEQRVLGYTHPEVGGCLASEWKLPRTLSEAISGHHVDRGPISDTHTADVVQVANFAAKRAYPDQQRQRTILPVSPQTLARLGMTSEDLEPLSETLMAEYEKAETFMQIAKVS